MAVEVQIGARSIAVVSGGVESLADVDALVSPDDEQLTHSGGASEAIWRVGGPRMVAAVESRAPSLSLGQVWASPAGALPVRRVLHAVTLSLHEERRIDAEGIGPLFRRVFEEAERCRCASLGLPLLGTGAGGLSREMCIQALVEALTHWVRGPSALRRIVLVDPRVEVAGRIAEDLSMHLEGVAGLDGLIERALQSLPVTGAAGLELAWERAATTDPGARAAPMVAVFSEALHTMTLLACAQAARPNPTLNKRITHFEAAAEALRASNTPLGPGRRSLLVKAIRACDRLEVRPDAALADLNALGAGLQTVLEHLIKTEAPKNPSATVVDGNLVAGATVAGVYEVVALRGEGGFGRVYEAVQSPMGRRVALKVLEVPGEEARQRFLREAQAASRIEHAAIVPVTDFGALGDGRPFLVMPWLEGHDLAHEIDAHGPLSPARLVRLIRPCLEALGEAHERGIVHKDLKPSNVFVEWPDRPKEAARLLDFGIAVVAEPAEPSLQHTMVPLSPGRLTVSNQALGTPQYMAPEYLEAQIVSPALDVYQLGLILVEALSGKPAVGASSWLSCALAHTEGALDIPESVSTGPLGAIIARATSKEPARRFEDAGAMLAALNRVDVLDEVAAVASEAMLPLAPATLPDLSTESLSTLRSRAPTGFVRIPTGTFLMGSPTDEMGRGGDETQHRVTIARPFLIQITPITQAQWLAVMGTNPSHFKGPDRPVENIHWYDALAYCNALSRREGLTEAYFLENPQGTPGKDLVCDGVISLGDTDGWRLPTEAEWEYAARAGERGAACGPLDSAAWTGGNSGDATQVVGTRAANAWGLFDMQGNVWEWVWDWYHSHSSAPVTDPRGPDRGAFKIARGGSWRSVAWAARLANRTRHEPHHHYSDTGFRVVRTLGWASGNALHIPDEDNL